ncbi:MAG: hypothetical protein KAV70_00495, partial [Bacteroidales bacterium]|nr:hypothetical protein [Bacteroidales bacterium]
AKRTIKKNIYKYLCLGYPNAENMKKVIQSHSIVYPMKSDLSVYFIGLFNGNSMVYPVKSDLSVYFTGSFT